MKLNKFDKIQLVFNILLFAATIMNVLVIMGIAPKYLSFIGFVMAIGGCIMTNTATGSKEKGHRQTVNGIPFLAGLTYFTGAAWLITFAVIQFGVVNNGVNAGQ